MPFAIAAIALTVVVAVMLFRRSRYYRRLFSDEHYAEVAEWASSVIDRHPVEESAIEDGTAVVTSAGLLLAYTSVDDEGDRSIHFSVSQRGSHTSAAVGGRVLFLLIRLLHRNECEANLFRTESTVHHAIFRMPAQVPWKVGAAEAAVADMAMYQPLPIERVNIAEEMAGQV